MLNINELLSKVTKKSAPGKEEIAALMNKVDFKIDQDYLDFIEAHDGAEGFVGDSSYIILWTVKDLISLNPYYGESIDNGYSKSLFLFGTNGGDTAYGIRKSDGVFIEAPFIGMSTETLIELGRNFMEFLSFLSNQ